MGEVDGTIVECNTAYVGSHAETAMQWAAGRAGYAEYWDSEFQVSA